MFPILPPCAEVVEQGVTSCLLGPPLRVHFFSQLSSRTSFRLLLLRCIEAATTTTTVTTAMSITGPGRDEGGGTRWIDVGGAPTRSPDVAVSRTVLVGIFWGRGGKRETSVHRARELVRDTSSTFPFLFALFSASPFPLLANNKEEREE